jgi:hypothetical protein
MRPVLLFAASLVLAWQAVLAVVALGGAAVGRAGVSWHERLFASTDDRMRRVLGADAELAFALRTMPPGTLMLCQKVTGSLEGGQLPPNFAELAARNGLLEQLTHLLYPDPFLLPTPTPIVDVENLTRRGVAAMLGVLPGDPEPTDRKGWTRTHASRFQAWQFRTD